MIFLLVLYVLVLVAILMLLSIDGWSGVLAAFAWPILLFVISIMVFISFFSSQKGRYKLENM